MVHATLRFSKLAIVSAIVLVALPALPVTATNLTVPTAGLVSIELVTSLAAFRNTLSIVSPAVAVASTGCKLEPAVGLGGVHILSEKLSQRGCRVQLDADPATAGTQPFPLGTVFTFGFCAQTDADADCEYVWSSDAASNPDGFDHLATTAIHAADFPGQIFQLAWEDLPGGGDLDFDDLVAILRVNVDSDGDGLWDDWEQFGVDTTGDGIVDLDLPALGADPMHKDIFLELDWMDCALAGSDCAAGDTHAHAPLAGVVDAVVAAFAAAPVTNPDGVNGIDLHVSLSNAVPHQQFLALGCGFGTSFDAVKADPANFGPANPRRFAYHYMIFAHLQASTTTSSGCAELPGNDALVTMGGFGGGTGTMAEQAGTLMHEFGHNLNLRHGGGDNTNYKPNYLSVMNYAFQLGGIPPDPDGGGPLTGRVDYSRSALPTLNEASLDETAGVGDGADSTYWFCPAAQIGPASGPIDWNCDGDSTDVGVSVDINGGAGTVLTGYDDWSNLKMDFQNTGDFEDGVHTSNVDLVEADHTIAELTPTEVGIDIRPGSGAAPVSVPSRGRIPVAILSSEGFDAVAEVDVGSLTFGRTGTEASLSSCNPGGEDVDGDGLLDLVCHFFSQKAGFQPGTTTGTLRGSTSGDHGHLIVGSDAVLVKA